MTTLRGTWISLGIVASLSLTACGGSSKDSGTDSGDLLKTYSATEYNNDSDALQVATVRLADVGFHFWRTKQPNKNPKGPAIVDQYMWDPNAVRASQAKSEDRQAALKNYMSVGSHFLRKYSGKVEITSDGTGAPQTEAERASFYKEMQMRQEWVEKYWNELVKQGKWYGADIQA